jgi:hypothetical protein
MRSYAFALALLLVALLSAASCSSAGLAPRRMMLEDAGACKDKCETQSKQAVENCMSALVRDGYTPDQVQEIRQGCESNADAGSAKCKATCKTSSKPPDTPATSTYSAAG